MTNLNNHSTKVANLKKPSMLRHILKFFRYNSIYASKRNVHF